MCIVPVACFVPHKIKKLMIRQRLGHALTRDRLLRSLRQFREKHLLSCYPKNNEILENKDFVLISYHLSVMKQSQATLVIHNTCILSFVTSKPVIRGQTR